MDPNAVNGASALIHGPTAEVLNILSEMIFIFCGIKALFHKNLKRVFLFALVGLVVELRSSLTVDSHFALSAFLFHVFNYSIIFVLVFLVAKTLCEKAGTEKLTEMRGVARVLPRLTIPMGIGLFAMMGLPPFSSFFSKFLLVFAFVDSGKLYNSILLAAGELLYFLVFIRVFRFLFLDKYNGKPLKDDFTIPKLAPLYGLVVFILIGGLAPALAFKPFAFLSGVLGASAKGAPPLSISWPITVVMMIFGAIAIYFTGQKINNNRISALAASALCLVSMIPLAACDADIYSKSFAFLVLFMGVLQFTYSVSYMEHSHKQYRFYCFFLLMMAGLVGVCLAKDLWSMFFWWEIMSGWVLYIALIHEEDAFSVQEASKYFTYNYFGAAILTVAVAAVYEETRTLNLEQLVQSYVFTEAGAVATALLTFVFLMKAAQLPFRIDFQMHPKPAPTPISGYISSTVLKSGPFMMVKIFFVAMAAGAVSSKLFTLAQIQHVAAWIGAITIVMAASFALLTNSMKRLLIFHTVSQLGYVVLGCALMTSIGLAGGLMHFVNHMFFKNLLFLCAGAVFIATGTDRMDQLGGLARKMPITFFCFMVGTLAISGVPLFNGFVSKWMIYHGCMDSGFIGLAIVSLFGSVLTLASFIKFMHSAYLGQLSEKLQDTKEASWYMLAPMLVFTTLCILLGIFPGAVMSTMNSILTHFNLEPLAYSPGMIAYQGAALNTLQLSALLIIASVVAWLLYKAINTKTRATHVYVCGVGDLTHSDAHVSSVNFYEDAKKFIKAVVRITKKSIGLQGEYVER